MRLRQPILFTAVYGAGLATGLLRFGEPLAVAALVLAGALHRRHAAVTLLAAGALLGRISGEIAWLREADQCAGRLPAGSIRLTARLLEPADSTGGRVDLLPLRAGCSSPVTARWPTNQPLEAGVTARVTGRWVPRTEVASRPSGTLVVSTHDSISDQPALSSRLRTALARTSRQLYGDRSPIVDALITGRRGGINRDLQDRFAQSGLVHLLSISGFHVGIITAWVFLFGRMVHLGRAASLGMGAAASVAYVAFLGWPAPATRAAALAVCLALTRSRQRLVDADALLSATCLCVMLVDPWSILDVGAWLSASALWGATTFSRWTDRTLGATAWWRTLGSSVGATLATAPITAAALGTVAIVGIGLNFLAIPLAAVAVPGVLASLLLFAVWQQLAASLAGGAGLALHLLELLAIGGAAVPGGHIVVPAEPRSAIPWLLCLAVSLWAIGKRNTPREALRRWGWAVVAALWLGLIWAEVKPLSHAGPGLALHFLDVGQGDGAVLRTPAGRWAIIDAGPRSDRADAGRRVMVPFLLRNRARELGLVVVSHAHADHLGGVLSVLDRYRASLVLEPGALVSDPLYYSFLEMLAAESIRWHPARRGDRIVLDGVQFSVLHPDPEWTGWGEDVNEDSLVLLVEYGSFQALFAGDAGFPAEMEMRSRARAVDLLKVGHHGSRGSTGQEWLDSLRPQAAVISVGRNSYGHPAPETLARLQTRGIELWRTDRDGEVVVTSDGSHMTVQSGDRLTTYDVR